MLFFRARARVRARARFFFDKALFFREEKTGTGTKNLESCNNDESIHRQLVRRQLGFFFV